MARKRKDKLAEFEARPDMQVLDTFTRQILKVPKTELDRLEREAKGTKDDLTIK